MIHQAILGRDVDMLVHPCSGRTPPVKLWDWTWPDHSVPDCAWMNRIRNRRLSSITCTYAICVMRTLAKTLTPAVSSWTSRTRATCKAVCRTAAPRIASEAGDGKHDCPDISPRTRLDIFHGLAQHQQRTHRSAHMSYIVHGRAT